jgi:hypothetical protein
MCFGQAEAESATYEKLKEQKFLAGGCFFRPQTP